MRQAPAYQAEKGRIKRGPLASDATYLNNGAFLIPCNGVTLQCICSDGYNWEHVSVVVSGEDRCPTWEEMCFIKDLFWTDDETVIQYHPPKSEYINNHNFCLHLWKPQNATLPLPDQLMVGVPGLT